MKKYFCGLDELFDTRLGLISVINQDVAQTIFEDKEQSYFYRPHDDYLWRSLGYTEEQWYQAWDNRDVNVLRNSLRTHVITIISDSILQYYNDKEEALSSKYTTLTINTYPYKLSDQELDELKEVIIEHIPVLGEINYICYSLKDLKPSILKEYDECYLYEYHRWMDIHGNELRDMLITGISLRVPRLFYKMMTEQDYQEIVKTKEGKKILELDIFKLFEAAVSIKIQITYIAASDFSVALIPPIYKDENIKDLDHQQGLYDSGTVDKSLFDPQV